MAVVHCWLVALAPCGTQKSLAAASTSARWSTDSWLAVSASSITMRARDDMTGEIAATSHGNRR